MINEALQSSNNVVSINTTKQPPEVEHRTFTQTPSCSIKQTSHRALHPHTSPATLSSTSPTKQDHDTPHHTT